MAITLECGLVLARWDAKLANGDPISKPRPLTGRWRLILNPTHHDAMVGGPFLKPHWAVAVPRRFVGDSGCWQAQNRPFYAMADILIKPTCPLVGRWRSDPIFLKPDPTSTKYKPKGGGSDTVDPPYRKARNEILCKWCKALQKRSLCLRNNPMQTTRTNPHIRGSILDQQLF